MQMLLMKQRCGGCESDVPMWSDVCFRCGRVLHPPGRLRAAGVLYLVLGLFLAAVPAYLIALVAGIVAGSGDPDATIRFSGGWREAALVFGFLGFVLLVGVLGILMGVWQIVHGRRNLALVRVAMVYYVIFWTGSMAIIWLM